MALVVNTLTNPQLLEGASWGVAAFMAFVPIAPALWLIQIPLAIVIIIIMIALGAGVWTTIWVTWLIQGIIVMFAGHWLYSTLFKSLKFW